MTIESLRLKVRDFLLRFGLYILTHKSEFVGDKIGNSPKSFKLTKDPNVWLSARAKEIADELVKMPYAVQFVDGCPRGHDTEDWYESQESLIGLFPYGILDAMQFDIRNDFNSEILEFVESVKPMILEISGPWVPSDDESLGLDDSDDDDESLDNNDVDAKGSDVKVAAA